MTTLSLEFMSYKLCVGSVSKTYIKWSIRVTNYRSFQIRAKKKPHEISREAYNKYGSYLLSRILSQYHRP
jgi:hypothetical protein